MALKDIEFRDFSGGLNSRDAASELADHEFPYSLNVTIDERGYLQKRLGYLNRHGSSTIGSGKVSNLFYWGSRNQVVEQVGLSLHLEGAASFKTFTTIDRCGMCEFAGSLFITHPIDGCFLYDGTTVTAVASGPKGNTCATWQNRVFVNEILSPARLWKSNVNNASVFTGTDFNDLREKDSNAITLITGASGSDIAGRPGLLVFKADSAYRVNDPATIAYTTIDAGIGAGSNIAGVSAYGRTYVISPRGIYSTDGLSPLREESRLVENFFLGSQMNQTRPDLLCAGRFQDRLYFSMPRASETANSVELELNPQENWLTMHSSAAAAYASIGRNVTDMVFGSPSVNGKIYNSHRGGSDDGAAIASAFQSRWVELNQGRKARIRQARVTGVGKFNSYVLRDYDDTDRMATLPIDISQPGFLYDDPASIYDASGVIYSSPSHQDTEYFWSIGVAKAASFYISETSVLTALGKNVLGGTTPPEVGAWSLSNMNLLAIDLGNV